MEILKALIKIIIITIQIGILLKIVLPLATASPVEDNPLRPTEMKAEKRLIMPPRFPYAAPFGYYGSGLLCIFTDTPYVGGWFGRSCQGPLPPFKLPTPPPLGTPDPTDPPRVPAKMNYLEGYYGYPWMTPTPPTLLRPTPPSPAGSSNTTDNSTLPMQPPRFPGPMNFLETPNGYPWMTPPPPTTVRPPLHPRPRPTTRVPPTRVPSTRRSTTTTATTTTSTTTTTETPSTTISTAQPILYHLPPFPMFSPHPVVPLIPGYYHERPHNPEIYAEYGEPVEGNPWEPDEEDVFIESYGVQASNPAFKLGDPNARKRKSI